MYAAPAGCAASDPDLAYRQAAAAGDGPAMARAVLDRAGFRLDDWRGDLPTLSLRSRIEHAAAALDPGSDLWLRLRLWQTALDDFAAGRHERIEALAQEAGRHGDPAVRAEAVNLLYQCLTGPEDADRRRELARRLVSLGLREERPATTALGLLWNCVELFRSGDPAASGAVHTLRTAVAGQDDPRLASLADRVAAILTLRAGRAGRVAGPHELASHWYQGRSAEAYASLAARADEIVAGGEGALMLAAFAQAAAAAGAARQAEAALARLSDIGRRAGDRDFPAALYWGVETAAALGDHDFAREAYRHLERDAVRPLAAPLDGVCFGSAEQALGVAAATLGDHPRAIHHLSAAVRANLALGHWPALVLTRVRLARCWHRHDPRSGAARAARELQLAARDASGLLVSPPEPDRRPPGAGAWPATVPDAPVDRLVLRRCGAVWEFILGWRRITVADMKGVGYLAVLVANPAREIRAADLATGPGERVVRQRLSAHPILDETAMRAYRERLDELREQSHRAGPGAERIRTEMEWLRSQLAAVTGPGGRRRAFADQDERARIAVGKAIRRAIERVTRLDPVIGAHLRMTVRTGAHCVFAPL